MDLREKLTALNVPLSPKQELNFRVLTGLLLEYNNHTNITGITDPIEIEDKHYFDSLSALRFIPENAKLCDIGTGGGFPALPIAIMREDVKVTAIDSIGKKMRFVTEAKNALGLDMDCLNIRAEEHLKTHKSVYDVLTFRAFSDLKAISAFAGLLNEKGIIIAYKGREDKAQEELKALDRVFTAETFPYELPNSNRRLLIIIKKK